MCSFEGTGSKNQSWSAIVQAQDKTFTAGFQIPLTPQQDLAKITGGPELIYDISKDRILGGGFNATLDFTNLLQPSVPNATFKVEIGADGVEGHFAGRASLISTLKLH